MYEQLKTLINQYIKTNGSRQITGAVLNNVLNEMVNSLGGASGYGGIITPTSQTPANDANIFYIAIQQGNYTNFGITVNAHELAFVKRSGNGWAKDAVPLGSGIVANPQGEATEQLSKIEIDGTVYQNPQGPAGQNGVDAVNPFKGWFTTANIPTTGQEGDYCNVSDISVTPHTVTIYRWNTTNNQFEDTGEVPDTATGETFASSETLQEVAIDDSHLENPVNSADPTKPVLSDARDVKPIKETVFGPKNLHYTLVDDYRIRYDNGTREYSTSTKITSFIPLYGISQIKYTRIAAVSGSSKIGMAFYTSESANSYISGERCIAGADENGYVETVLDVPSTANYARFTVLNIDVDGFYVKNNITGLTVEVDDLKTRADIVEENVETIDENISYLEDLPYVVLKDGGIEYDTGDLSGKSYHTDYINIEGISRLFYSKCVTKYSVATLGIAFYSDMDVTTYISGIPSGTGAADSHYVNDYADVPSEAKYVRLTIISTLVDDFFVKNAEKKYLSYEGVKGLLEDYINQDNYYKGKNIVVIGPSTVYGTTVSNRNEVWTQIMGRMLGANVVNLGIGGSTTAKKEGTYDDVYLDYEQWQYDVAHDLVDTTKKYLVKDNINVPVRPYHIYSYSNGEWVKSGNTSSACGRTPIVDRIGEIDADTDIIIIQDGFGGNDWAYNWVNIGNEDDSIPTTYYGALNIICQTLLENFEQKLILFVSYPFAWRYQPQGISLAQFDMTTYDAVNTLGYSGNDFEDALLRTLDKYGIAFLDVRKDLQFAQIGSRWWCGDNDGKYVHPGAIAQSYIASTTIAKLNTLRVPF